MLQQVASCPFCCDWAAGQDVVHETEWFFLRWDKYPVAPGHLLIIPKRHVERIRELSDAEGAALVEAIKLGIGLVEIKAGPDAVNIGINDGKAAGQTVHHLHIHIIPRRIGDVPDRGAECGVSFLAGRGTEAHAGGAPCGPVNLHYTLLSECPTTQKPLQNGRTGRNLR